MKRWIEAEVDYLRAMRMKGVSRAVIAADLGKSKHEIKRKCIELGITTRSSIGRKNGVNVAALIERSSYEALLREGEAEGLTLAGTLRLAVSEFLEMRRPARRE